MKPTLPADGSFVLAWDKHEHSRTTTLKSLWENKEYLDVTIACDDDQINAHKVILSAASPFFHKILKRNPHSHPLLYLRGTTTKYVQSLLDFIYSGETRVPQEELEVKGLVDDKFIDSSKALEEKETKSHVSHKSRQHLLQECEIKRMLLI